MTARVRARRPAPIDGVGRYTSEPIAAPVSASTIEGWLPANEPGAFSRRAVAAPSASGGQTGPVGVSVQAPATSSTVTLKLAPMFGVCLANTARAIEDSGGISTQMRVVSGFVLSNEAGTDVWSGRPRRRSS